MLGLPRATIDEACAAPVLVTLAGDLREELPGPLPAPARGGCRGQPEAARDRARPTALTRSPPPSLRIRPGDAPLMATALTGDDAAATALGTHPEGGAVTTGELDAARGVLAAHPDGEGVVIVAGRPSYAESGEVAAEAVRALAAALPKATFLPALRRGNVFGALDMGLAPGILPGPGQPRCGPPALHRRLGLGPRRRRALDGRHPRLHGGRDANGGRTAATRARPGPARCRPAR